MVTGKVRLIVLLLIISNACFASSVAYNKLRANGTVAHVTTIDRSLPCTPALDTETSSVTPVVKL